MTQANRKRGRDMEEDCGDFMPLTKRINNLDLNMAGAQQNQSEQGDNWSNPNFVPSPTHFYRKRGRDMEEDCGEFMPLTKRINNLHLNMAGAQQNPSEQGDNWSNPNFVPSPTHSEPSQGSSSSDGFSSSQNSYYPMEYRPDLSASENPHYYENNRLLFNLHMEQIQRTGNFY